MNLKKQARKYNLGLREKCSMKKHAGPIVICLLV